MNKELKYLRADLEVFCKFMNEKKIQKENILHINSYMASGIVYVIMIYWE